MWRVKSRKITRKIHRSWWLCVESFDFRCLLVNFCAFCSQCVNESDLRDVLVYFWTCLLWNKCGRMSCLWFVVLKINHGFLIALNNTFYEISPTGEMCLIFSQIHRCNECHQKTFDKEIIQIATCSMNHFPFRQCKNSINNFITWQFLISRNWITKKIVAFG